MSNWQEQAALASFLTITNAYVGYNDMISEGTFMYVD
jgi:hypothetical protein